MKDDFEWLIKWFSSQCDGDWEHQYGITLGSLDNPGWRLSISLEGTELENKNFNSISIERNSNDWIFCFLKDNCFEAACGVFNLPEGIALFKQWTEKCQKENT